MMQRKAVIVICY